MLSHGSITWNCILGVSPTHTQEAPALHASSGREFPRMQFDSAATWKTWGWLAGARVCRLFSRTFMWFWTKIAHTDGRIYAPYPFWLKMGCPRIILFSQPPYGLPTTKSSITWNCILGVSPTHTQEAPALHASSGREFPRMQFDSAALELHPGCISNSHPGSTGTACIKWSRIPTDAIRLSSNLENMRVVGRGPCVQIVSKGKHDEISQVNKHVCAQESARASARLFLHEHRQRRFAQPPNPGGPQFGSFTFEAMRLVGWYFGALSPLHDRADACKRAHAQWVLQLDRKTECWNLEE